MRIAIALLLAALALVQAWFDWGATIGEGYAYRFTSIGAALRRASPATASWLVENAPWFWSLIAVLPLALVLFGVAALVWLSGRRRR